MDEGPTTTGVPADRFQVGLAGRGRHQGWFDRCLRLVIRGWCRAVGWRVAVRGLDRLPVGAAGMPGEGCVVAVAPHRAWIDPFLLLAAWPADAARPAWMGDGITMTRSVWRRWLLPRLGMIPIAPGHGDPRAYAEQVAAVTAAGRALVIFPEKGRPSPPDRTRAISPGFAYLALRAGVPVVPVVLGGTHRIVRGSPFSVDVLPAILPARAAMADPFTPPGRDAARALVAAYGAAVAPVLAERTALADARRPAHDRWRWLGTLFH